MTVDIFLRKKVAIVGSGCSGIAALWALNRTHHDVYLYEAADRIGGHTNTVDWRCGKYTAKVDTGFIVMNKATYPNFIEFLNKINVATAQTSMTFSVCRDWGLFEWAGTSLDSLFCQRKNLLSPLMDDGAGKSIAEALSIGHYLEREGYSDAFRDDYLIPMTAAVWSTKPGKCALEFPATTLVRFLWNHHLLSTMSKRPPWLTISTGASSYLDVVLKGFPSNHLFLNSPVRALTNDRDGRVRLHLDGERSEVYDHVILAIHGDDALSVVESSATPEEKEVLSCFKTEMNTAVLHSDISLLPTSRKAWSSWNYLSLSSDQPPFKAIDQVSLTYNMNILQHIPADIFGNVLVTLNPLTEPNRATVQGQFNYRHPLYTASSVKAQLLLPRIQNTRGISYAGAWTKYGFHEDGFTSGLSVAVHHLGAKLPFDIVDSKFSRGSTPRRSISDSAVRLILCIIQVFFIRVIEKILRIERQKKQIIPISGLSEGSPGVKSAKLA